MYRMYLKQDTEQIELPVPPSELCTKVGNSNKTISILNVGEVNLLQNIGLREFQFTILLPQNPLPNVPSAYDWKEPIFYLNHFRQYKKSKKPVSFIIFRQLSDGTQLFDGNIEVSFEEYTVKEKAGEQGDFWVELHFKEYRKITSTPYKVEKRQEHPVLVATGVSRSGRKIPQTYTVKKGDNLWKIAKLVLNDGSKYTQIAQKNGISEPSKIYPGQVLKLGG